MTPNNRMQRAREFLRSNGHRELASWTSRGIVDTSGANEGPLLAESGSASARGCPLLGVLPEARRVA